MTGTVDSRTTRSISDAPAARDDVDQAAGVQQLAHRRAVGRQQLDEPAGSPAFSAASVRTATSAVLVRNADAEPRSSAAFRS